MRARTRMWGGVTVVALVVAAIGMWRARDLGPGLTFAVERLPREGGITPYRLTATPRGGEELGEVALELPGDWVEIYGPRAARGLPYGTDFVTTLRVDESAGPAQVTVRLTARIERVYPIDLAERSR